MAIGDSEGDDIGGGRRIATNVVNLSLLDRLTSSINFAFGSQPVVQRPSILSTSSLAEFVCSSGDQTHSRVRRTWDIIGFRRSRLANGFEVTG
jgi:hypothetical protein